MMREASVAALRAHAPLPAVRRSSTSSSRLANGSALALVAEAAAVGAEGSAGSASMSVRSALDQKRAQRVSAHARDVHSARVAHAPAKMCSKGSGAGAFLAGPTMLGDSVYVGRGGGASGGGVPAAAA